MKWMFLAVILPVVAFGAASRGSVSGSRFRADFVSPSQMRLKVMSPEGATVEIRANNKLLARGTIPFEYTPPQEGFVSVSVVLPSGKRWWGNSVRMKAQTECDLYVAEPSGRLPAMGTGAAKAPDQARTPAPAVEPPGARSVAPAESLPEDVPPPAEPGKSAPPPDDDVPPLVQPKGSRSH